MPEPVCKDCIDEGITTYRKPVEGAARNRCTTHQRNRRATTRVSAHARLCARYGITEEEYQAIKASQGGKCFICQKATGARKALAIDHDHALGYTREAVRAVLCGPCNKMIGYLDVMALARAIVVLQDHPAQKVLNSNESAL